MLRTLIICSELEAEAFLMASSHCLYDRGASVIKGSLFDIAAFGYLLHIRQAHERSIPAMCEAQAF